MPRCSYDVHVKLAQGNTKEPCHAQRPREETQRAETGKEFIIALVKGRQATTTGQIKAAWRRSGRPDRADNNLYELVKAGTLKRLKLPGQKGSRYSFQPAPRPVMASSGPLA